METRCRDSRKEITGPDRPVDHRTFNVSTEWTINYATVARKEESCVASSRVARLVSRSRCRVAHAFRWHRVRAQARGTVGIDARVAWPEASSGRPRSPH